MPKTSTHCHLHTLVCEFDHAASCAAESGISKIFKYQHSDAGQLLIEICENILRKIYALQVA